MLVKGGKILKSIVLQNVSKSYNGIDNVLQELNLTIQPGEFFILVGPSGCGKSTMLRMIAGLDNPTTGEMYFDGKLVNYMEPSSRDLSMVFQNYALFPHMTVRQNITFGLYKKKLNKKQQEQKCLEACQMLGIEALLDRKPKEISGGQRQRVALARAIVSESSICLMDEPLSNLDAKLRNKMRLELKQIQKRLGFTMVYVTHDQVEAMTMADRMMILNNGVVQQIGKPLDVYNNPKNEYVATFIGAPSMNIFKIEDINLSANQFDLSVKKIGIRPEHLVPESTNGALCFDVEVIASELLGTETIVSFNLFNRVCQAKWSGQYLLEDGQKAKVYVDPKSIIMFDQNGDNIHHKKVVAEHAT